ncbi:MAG: hypothetical protein K2M47_05885 [Clostridiales bacterium]|nr:hypothetical protein [Clostridiales bacterium]
MDLPHEQQIQLAKLIDDYKEIAAFRRARRRLNYMQFDYAVVNDLTLFMIEPEFSFEALEQRIDVILGALPAIKRIFAQPFIHLKQRNVILPVESVRTVNNDTLNHIATHSELWADVKNGEIKPDKLLTITYEDNYGIYENLVFCKLVDNILAFSRSNIRFLKEMIYTTQTIEFNLLERVNHLNYFLALGKIHIGYSQNYAEHYGTAVRCLNKLQFIVNTIVPRLKRPVYKNNKHRHANVKIHKTNILSMHKEYHRIYKLALYFAHNNQETVANITNKDLVALIKNYYYFCQALCIFAAGHFNFVCNVTKAFDMSKFSLDFAFKKWSLRLERITVDDWRALAVTVKKNKPYKVILIPSLLNNNDAVLQKFKDAVNADEYIVCSPYEDCDPTAVLVGITSIESFRRVQQIILRAMIYADEGRDECPFCNSKLTVNGELSTEGSPVYECLACRTQIYGARCSETDKPYFYTKIAGQKPRQEDDDEQWLEKRKDESKMYFRNITETDDQFNPVCPHCGKVHETV